MKIKNKNGWIFELEGDVDFITRKDLRLLRDKNFDIWYDDDFNKYWVFTSNLEHTYAISENVDVENETIKFYVTVA